MAGVKVWSGSAFVDKPLKVWNGSSWISSSAVVSGTTVTDNFTRTDGAIGANWAVYPVGGYVIPTITSNQVKGVANTEFGAYWSADTFANDQYAEGAFYWHDGNAWMQVTVRNATGANTKYGALWSSDGGGQYLIYKKVAGTETTLAGPTTGVGTAYTTRTLRLEVVGTSLEMFVNGASVLTATDSAITSGYPGFNYYAGSSNTVDNFAAGDM